MRVSLSAALLIALFPLSSWSECPTIDLRDSPGFKDRKQVYQSDTNWCFAFSRADIVSQKLGRPVSPVDIAIRYFDFHGVKEFDAGMATLSGGDQVTLNNLAQKQPFYCSENNYGNAKDLLSLPMYGIIQTFDSLKKGCRPQLTFGSDLLFKNISDIQDVLVATYQDSKNKVDFLVGLNRENCKEKIDASLDFEIKLHIAAWDNEEAHQETKKYLIQVLQSGKMLSAAIDSTLLMKDDSSFFRKIKANLAGDHSVTVTGMIEKNGQCYFQIRDSSNVSTEECKDLKVSQKIDCIKDQDYDVPEDIFLKSLKITTTVK